jgi:hypothetical protein
MVIVSVISLWAGTQMREYNFRRQTKVDQTIPLQGKVNQIIFHADSFHTMHVSSVTGKKLYKIQRSGDKWHIQGPNKRLLATVKNKWFEKYIVLSNNQYGVISTSPLNTTPSVIKLQREFFGSADSRDQRKFTFGSNAELIWCGLNHFEVVTAPVGQLQVEEVHQRVAWVSSKCKDKYTIMFQYDSINLEILVSTFLLALLTKGKRLNRPKIGVAGTIDMV